jgi:hypothetical protein
LSKSSFVDYQGNGGFWAYDVALGIFLKHLIDAAEEHAAASGEGWLREEAADWRRIAGLVETIGLDLDCDRTWTMAQRDVFVNVVKKACANLAQRNQIPAAEIETRPIFEDLRLSTRGEAVVATAPIVELGRAIVSLIQGTLDDPPTNTLWYYGWPEGRLTMPYDPDLKSGGNDSRNSEAETPRFPLRFSRQQSIMGDAFLASQFGVRSTELST